MKTYSNRRRGFIPAFVAALIFLAGFTGARVHAQDYNNGYGNNGYSNNDDGYYDNGDYQEFYDDLAPYGQWMNDPQYGYVWSPNAGRGFRPYYTNGHWAMTEYGNMWVSDYDWGWAPFHYGRWAQSNYYGWIWIPGNVWGPAWVNWRQGGGYYGWSPMGPGISINISFGSGYAAPYDWWTFIPCNNIYARSYAPYYSPRRTVNIYNNTTIINNTYVDNRSRNTYVSGPRRTDIERTTRQRVTVYNVNNRSRSGATAISGRNVEVYRPRIAAVPSRSQERPAPRQVKTLDRTAVTNPGGGKPPVRSAVPQMRNGNDRSAQQLRDAQVQQNRGAQMQQQRAQRDQQMQQPRVSQDQQRMQRDQQMQQQRIQRDQQLQQQRVQQDQQKVQRDQQRIQRDQQVQQQRAAQQQEQQVRMQRDQQAQQRAQQEQMRSQRDQQIQQQRAQQEQMRSQRDQQMQQQRAQQEQMRSQREQQVQQQRAQQEQIRSQRSQQVQQQRTEERAQPQPRSVERSAPAPQRSVERSPRGR